MANNNGIPRLEPIRIRLNPVQNRAFPLILAANTGNPTQLTQLLETMDEDSLRENIDRPNNDGINALMVACCQGRLDIAQILIHYCANPNAIKGVPPIHFAVRNMNSDCVELLIKAGCNVNAIDGEGSTALHYASRLGSEQIVNLLVEAEAEVNKKDAYGRTPLHWACILGNQEILLLLLSSVYLPNHKLLDGDGRTALMRAAEFGRYDCFESLISEFKLGKDEINRKDGLGMTALHLAALNGEKEMVDHLIDSKADVHALDKWKRIPLHAAASSTNEQCVRLLLEADKSTVNTLDFNSRTPLFYAAKFGRRKCIRMLLSYAADHKIQDYTGLAPPHWLCYYGFHKCLPVFTDVDFSDFRDKSGNTLLHIAASNGQNKCVAFLLDRYRIDPNAKNKKGQAAAHMCAKKDLHECLKLLFSKGADINIADNLGRTVLHMSCHHNAFNCVKILVERGADPTMKDSKNRTPLHLLARFGKIQTAKLLIKKNEELVNQIDSLGRIPLHYSCLYGNEELTTLFISQKANVQSRDLQLRTAVHMAAIRGDTRCLSLLHGSKAPMGSEDKYGMTPVFFACYGGHKGATSFLLDKIEGVDINKRDSIGRTAIELACYNKSRADGHSDFMKLLISKKADVHVVDQNGQNVFHHLAKFKESVEVMEMFKELNVKIDQTDKEGNNPLHIAAMNKNYEGVRSLLEWKPDLSLASNKKGWIPLHYACYSGGTDIVDMLTEHCRPAIDSKDKKGRTPMHISAFFKNKRCINALASEQAQVDLQDLRGEAPLHHAAFSGSQECCDILIERGATQAVNKKGMTALHVASSRGFVEVCDLLVDMEWDINAKDKKQRSPLMYACWGDSFDTLKKLIDKGANVNSKDKFGYTPLIISSACGKRNFVEILLQAGANIFAKDAKGRTCLHWALNRSQRETFEFLKSSLSVEDLHEIIPKSEEVTKVEISTEVSSPPIVAVTPSPIETALPVEMKKEEIMNIPGTSGKVEIVGNVPHVDNVVEKVPHEDLVSMPAIGDKKSPALTVEEMEDLDSIDEDTMVVHSDDEPQGFDNSSPVEKAEQKVEKVSIWETKKPEDEEEVVDEEFDDSIQTKEDVEDIVPHEFEEEEEEAKPPEIPKNIYAEKLQEVLTLKGKNSDLDLDIAYLQANIELTQRTNTIRLSNLNLKMQKRRESLLKNISAGIRSDIQPELASVPSVMLYKMLKKPDHEMKELINTGWLISVLLLFTIVVEFAIVIQ